MNTYYYGVFEWRREYNIDGLEPITEEDKYDVDVWLEYRHYKWYEFQAIVKSNVELHFKERARRGLYYIGMD